LQNAPDRISQVGGAIIDGKQNTDKWRAFLFHPLRPSLGEVFVSPR
jgi:hypothetical protein